MKVFPNKLQIMTEDGVLSAISPHPEMAEPMEVDLPRRGPFLLLHLPKDALKQVLELLHCVDLIDFSLCSKRCHQLAKAINHRVDAIYLSVMAFNTMIMLQTRSESRGIIDFESTLPKLPVTIRFISRRYISVCKQSDIYYCRNPITTSLTVKPMAEYLTELFKAPLNICLVPGINLRAVFTGFTRCESLEIAGLPFVTSITPDDLSFVFETIKPNGRFALNVPHSGTFHAPEVPLFFDVDHLEMMNTASWMTGDLFRRLSCNRIRLSFCHLTAKDIEAFVTQWFFSNANHLEYVEIWHKMCITPISFKNCDLRTWDSNRRARYYNNTPHTFIDVGMGFDIYRRDGVIASVLIHSGSFHFIVWKNPFPLYHGTFLMLS